ncbi:MAG TPA: hypothetical protein VNC78_03520 [Actinomycetota bacterium]|nr:hypothetical protein [Actinomycetota bacterium]
MLVDPVVAPAAELGTAPPGTRVRVILTDGSEVTTSVDPELTQRIDYAAKNLLPPT